MMIMGFLKETTKSRQVILRSIKTIFFILNMFFSLLLLCFAAPIFLIIILDAILPSALLLSSSSSPSQTIYSHFIAYNFRSSLIDIPLISLIRSAFILCVYTISHTPTPTPTSNSTSTHRPPYYLGISIICSVSSLVFVSFKASFVFSRRTDLDLHYVSRALEMGLFVSSLLLAVAHMVVAYRTSCRERRRKLLIYNNIDIEAVSAYKKGFLMYQKMIEEERTKKDDINNKLGKL